MQHFLLWNLCLNTFQNYWQKPEQISCQTLITSKPCPWPNWPHSYVSLYLLKIGIEMQKKVFNWKLNKVRWKKKVYFHVRLWMLFSVCFIVKESGVMKIHGSALDLSCIIKSKKFMFCFSQWSESVSWFFGPLTIFHSQFWRLLPKNNRIFY